MVPIVRRTESLAEKERDSQRFSESERRRDNRRKTGAESNSPQVFVQHYTRAGGGFLPLFGLDRADSKKKGAACSCPAPKNCRETGRKCAPIGPQHADCAETVAETAC